MKIIKFSAIWCSGCLVMRPIWNKIIEKYNNFEIVNYDYDMDEDMVNKYNIGSILPVAIILKDGKEITRIIGEKKESQVIEIIDEVLNEIK